MAKFFGPVGYGYTHEISPGVTEEKIKEVFYYGDIVKNNRRLDSSDKVISDLSVSNVISIIADAYMYQNFFAIRYVKWMGVPWRVVNVDVQRPRLILTLGSVWNGPTD